MSKKLKERMSETVQDKGAQSGKNGKPLVVDKKTKK